MFLQTNSAFQRLTRPTLERRKTLGHLRSINPNMIIIHFANQSQTCQLLKILKNCFFFQTFHEKKLWKVKQSISGWTDIENPYRLSRASYTYVCRVLGINDLSHRKFTGWAIIEGLSICRRLRTFIISWGLKTRVKHCHVDLSSWYELCRSLSPRGYSEEFPADCAITGAITYHVSTQRQSSKPRAYLTAMFGHYIGRYFNN